MISIDRPAVLVGVTWAALFVASAPRSAPAQEPLTPVVMVAPRLSGEQSHHAATAVGAQLGDLPVRFAIEWVDQLAPTMRAQVDQARQVAARHGAAAVFWADLSVPENVFLYIAEPSGGRILVRGISAGGQDEEGRLETIAVIVRGAVKAILAGGEIGVAAPPPEQPAPEPEPLPDRFDASLGYLLELYSDEEPVIHGAALGVSVKLVAWLRLHLGYRLQLPVRVENRYAALDIRPHPLLLGTGGRWSLGDSAWQLDAALSLVVDIVTLDPDGRAPGVTAGGPDHKWLFAVAPRVALGRRFGRVVTVFAAVTVDLLFNEHRYVVSTPSGNEPIVEPWTVRPLLQIGASFTLL